MHCKKSSVIFFLFVYVNRETLETPLNVTHRFSLPLSCLWYLCVSGLFLHSPAFLFFPLVLSLQRGERNNKGKTRKIVLRPEARCQLLLLQRLSIQTQAGGDDTFGIQPLIQTLSARLPQKTPGLPVCYMKLCPSSDNISHPSLRSVNNVTITSIAISYLVCTQVAGSLLIFPPFNDTLVYGL